MRSFNSFTVESFHTLMEAKTSDSERVSPQLEIVPIISDFPPSKLIDLHSSPTISYWILLSFSLIIKKLKFLTHFNRWSDLTDKIRCTTLCKNPLKRLLH